jgi:hypothetical protein
MWYKTPTVTSPTKIPSFHDGYFDGVWIGPNKLVKFFLRTVNEQSFVLMLEGVQSLVLTDIRQGNIILDLVIRNSAEITPSDIKELHGVGPDKPQAASLLKTAMEQDLQVLEINPSYGANGLVLFQNWNPSQREVEP